MESLGAKSHLFGCGRKVKVMFRNQRYGFPSQPSLGDQVGQKHRLEIQRVHLPFRASAAGRKQAEEALLEGSAPMVRATYAYGVVIMPPPDLIREIRSLRERHPLLRSPVPPHITVKSPFLFRASGAQVVERLEAICEEWEPFEIRLCGLGLFRSSILYARVEESERLTQLHKQILDDLEGYIETLQDRYDGEAYTPHLTLADKLAPEDVTEARRLLSDLRVNRRFTVSQLHLLRGKGRWDVMRSFDLGDG